MINKYVIDSDILRDLYKRRTLRKKIAQRMILESKFSRVTKFCFVIAVVSLLVYLIHHDINYGHFIHTSPPPLDNLFIH